MERALAALVTSSCHFWLLLLPLLPLLPFVACEDQSCHVITIFGLKTADCSKHNAEAIPHSLLDGVRSFGGGGEGGGGGGAGIQVMRFEDNRLTQLDDDEFGVYPNLQEIYLTRNKIEVQ